MLSFAWCRRLVVQYSEMLVLGLEILTGWENYGRITDAPKVENKQWMLQICDHFLF